MHYCRCVVYVIGLLVGRTHYDHPVASEDCLDFDLDLFGNFILVVSIFEAGIHDCGEYAVFEVVFYFGPFDGIDVEYF